MRTSTQHIAVVKKVNKTLRILKKQIENKAGDINELIHSLATTENSFVAFWSLYLKNNIVVA